MTGQNGFGLAPEAQLSGILLIDKPESFTSFDVVAKVRGIARTRKVGHGGTLDPMATGVLPLFLGGATKACDILPDQTKAYEAWFRLGQTTDTQDRTGRVLTESPVSCTAAQVEEALSRFTGDFLQLPPMYSAIWVQGRRLYDLAREGVEVERDPRPVTVHELRLLEVREAENLYKIYVACSKGTYVRTICHDVGQALGCGAVLTGLRRVISSGYRVEDAITIQQAQQLADEGALEQKVLPVETAFAAYPAVSFSAKNAKMFQNGVRIALAKAGCDGISGDFRVLDPDGQFLGIGYGERDELRIRKLFVR
ncbi:MAG: tRNA pseudouridine(55) synthase TruB [Oscillospiraceae bacterium]|nr:tRNA pseudouridine(55) synthase TruB [Oscillospiraceae bacterium]